MRAVVFDRYGPPDVLRVEERERPAPEAGEVLVRVAASTVNRTDCGLRSAEYLISRLFTGLVRPKRGVTGMELAGEVVEIGPGVTGFASGDRVFGIRSGANAEFVRVREQGVLAHMPAGMSFERAAAACDGGITALVAVRAARLTAGQSIVVYGATGSIGTAAVQVAKATGAHVTAVCNTRNVALVRSLGADEVVDYEQEDFTRNGKQYDVVFDAVGKHSFRRCRRSLKPRGIYLGTDPGVFWHLPVLALLTRWSRGRKVKLLIATYAKEDLLRLRDLVEAGVYEPVIDRTYPLEQVVEATRYVETGQKTGNVVLTLAPSP